MKPDKVVTTIAVAALALVATPLIGSLIVASWRLFLQVITHP